jgi:hypothetical protein
LLLLQRSQSHRRCRQTCCCWTLQLVLQLLQLQLLQLPLRVA